MSDEVREARGARGEYGFPSELSGSRGVTKHVDETPLIKRLNPIKLVGFGILGAALGVGAYVLYESLDEEVKAAIRERVKRSTAEFVQQILALDTKNEPSLPPYQGAS